MKKFKTFLLTFFATFLICGSAMALPSLDSGYSWNNSAYWNPIHDSNPWEIIMDSNSGRDAAFGLYSFEDPSDKLELFNVGDSVGTKVTVRWDLGQYSKNGGTAIDFSLDTPFGVYFEIYKTDGTLLGTVFSDEQYNTSPNYDDGGHYRAAYNDFEQDAMFFVNVRTDAEGDENWVRFRTSGHDIDPIPEPASFVLFGLGLLGLAGFSRRRIR